jgi:hypothetical protein
MSRAQTISESMHVTEISFKIYFLITIPKITNMKLRKGTLYPQKLAIISPTSGGRSVGIVR